MGKKIMLLMVPAIFLNVASTKCYAEGDVVRHIKNCPTELSAGDLERISISGAKKSHPYPIGNLVSINRFDVTINQTKAVDLHRGMALAKSYVAASHRGMDAVDSVGERNCAYVFFTRNRDQSGQMKTDRLTIEFSPISYAKPMVKPAQSVESEARRPAPTRRGKMDSSAPAVGGRPPFPPPPRDAAPSRPRPPLPIPMQHDPRIVPPAPLLPPR